MYSTATGSAASRVCNSRSSRLAHLAAGAYIVQQGAEFIFMLRDGSHGVQQRVEPMHQWLSLKLAGSAEPWALLLYRQLCPLLRALPRQLSSEPLSSCSSG